MLIVVLKPTKQFIEFLNIAQNQPQQKKSNRQQQQKRNNTIKQQQQQRTTFLVLQKIANSKYRFNEY